MSQSKTLMWTEAREAGQIVRRQVEANASLMRDLGARLRALKPRLVLTCARGSSDHAAGFGKYAIETRLGVLVASHAPSTSSIFGTPLRDLDGALFLVISQSGKSPDILTSIAFAKEAGAFVVAMVNDANSPAAKAADVFIPLHAGPELAVAATKSYIASLSAIIHLVAEWREDADLLTAIHQAGDHIHAAFHQDWSRVGEALLEANSLFVIGRGLTFGIAHEMALKLKETSALHAEAFSAAEVRHGPMAIVEAGFPVILIAPMDEAAAGFPALSEEFAARHAKVFASGGPFPGAIDLPTQAGLHPLIAPLCQVSSFYACAEALARARGRNPDSPPWLNKVTETQ
ncbi:SIS domain-containing protein [Aquidulcibacter paucihalophilus]|uniref:SIS domain-containing protein n=1 Tax=Aquidulcibacter paucihalophilus TaxID=1978549 RepID=UPI001E30521B|nr:SIS domain-containing protein [Aquidulcibacter paucihalophilus]